MDMFTAILNAANGAVQATCKFLDLASGDKYTKNIENYSTETDKIFEARRNLIISDVTIPTEQKNVLLRDLGIEQEEMKRRYGYDIRENQRETAKVCLNVLAGVVSAGISVPFTTVYSLQDTRRSA